MLIRPTIALAAILAGSLASTSALAHRPLPWQRGPHVGPWRAAYKAPGHSASGTWQTLTNPYPGPSFPDTPVLLTDGSVLMHAGCTATWYKLSPDSSGSYVSGSWTKAHSMSTNYRPLYFASQVLADGRLIINGGEYLACKPTWTNLGALYDPVKDKWTPVAPPAGWAMIGDAQSVVLPDKTYMLADCCTTDEAWAKIQGNVVTWTATGTGKADENDEEGWTLLPDQTILSVDANINLNGSNNSAESYSAGCGCWTGIKPTANQVVDPGSHELGPAPLLPNGLVFQIGSTGNNDVYEPVTGKWTVAPQFNVDGALDAADGPAAVLPNGKILAQVSPLTGCGNNIPFCPPSHFFEVAANSPTNVTATQVSEPATAPNQASFEGRMLVLPTGQVFWTSDVGDIEIYTPTGKPKAEWKPAVTSVPKHVARGSANNVVEGTLFNGLTFGGYYGDDVQTSTNYPLVRITRISDGLVCYARTHDHATMGISDGGPTSTQFDVPTSCGPGSSRLQVIANGIASAPAHIKVL